MWFDIIRKKVVNMDVVKDIIHHLDGVFHYSKSMPNKIKNSKYNDARSTYNYIKNNMYVIEYDNWYEERAPKVRESEAYVKRFENVRIAEVIGPGCFCFVQDDLIFATRKNDHASTTCQH